MAEDKPSLHIDSDWKRQAQEEKRRLAEQEQQNRKATAATPVGVVAGTSTAAPERPQAPRGGGVPREARELPPATMDALVQSLVTQVLYYLGDITARGQEPTVNFDMAKHHIDTLSLLEAKTTGNLSPEEKQSLDAALYETRMRYISTASRYAELP
jgi:transposase-like protein